MLLLYEYGEVRAFFGLCRFLTTEPCWCSLRHRWGLIHWEECIKTLFCPKPCYLGLSLVCSYCTPHWNNTSVWEVASLPLIYISYPYESGWNNTARLHHMFLKNFDYYEIENFDHFAIFKASNVTFHTQKLATSKSIWYWIQKEMCSYTNTVYVRYQLCQTMIFWDVTLWTWWMDMNVSEKPSDSGFV